MRRKIIIVMGACLMVLFSPRGATPQTAPTASVSAHLQMVTYSAKARVQTGKVTAVSVSCHPGEQMLGGGFTSLDLFEYAAYIQASYPSSTTTWTVIGSAPTSFFDVEADVYCLKARLPLGIHIVQATGTNATRVVCPQGTVLLSGGFQSSQPIGVSHELGNGWMSASANASIQVYALCAASHVLHGQAVTSLFNPHSSSHGFARDGSNVVCPAGQVATGGGFESKDLVVGSQMNGLTFASWSVVAGGDANVMISAACVQLQG